MNKPEAYKQQILYLLFNQPGLSRADLAELLKVDRATVTRICKELIDELEIQPGEGSISIEESQDEQSNSPDTFSSTLNEETAEPTLDYVTKSESTATVMLGRRREPLKLHEGKRCFVVLEVQFNLIRSGLISPYGDVFWDNSVDYPAGPKDSSELLSRVLSITKQAIIKAQILNYIPGGIGIGISGLVDPQNGRLVYSDHLGVTESYLELKNVLFHEFGLPCAIDNDAKCCCYDVMTFGSFQDKQHFLYVLGDLELDPIDSSRYKRVGIGTALVLNSQVMYGNNGFTGEFRSIFAKPSVLGQLGWEHKLEPHQARSDSSIRQRFLQELSVQVAFLVHYLDLEAVYFGGGIESLKDELEPMLLKDIDHTWLYRNRVSKSVHLHFALNQSKPVLRGAGALIARSRYGATG
jgi:predicted NBD/HSP70 family sugar kinase